MFAASLSLLESGNVPRTVAAVCMGLLLTGCSPSDTPEATTPASSAASAPANATAPSAPSTPTVGGDGSDIQLDALTEADVDEASLSGELACSFAIDHAQPLLFASGNVGTDDAAQGVVKVSGYVERVGAPGGFNGMLEGATFSGKGKTIEIALTGAATEGGESPPRPATLTYQRADGASRAFDGLWQCGP